jgi:hypothetical protein
MEGKMRYKDEREITRLEELVERLNSLTFTLKDVNKEKGIIIENLIRDVVNLEARIKYLTDFIESQGLIIPEMN